MQLVARNYYIANCNDKWPRGDVFQNLVNSEPSQHIQKKEENGVEGGGPGASFGVEVVEAHEALVEADKGNRQKFQDVLSFLKVQTGDSDLID